jgi:ABC-type sugar transport system substrate-binding protein
MTDAEIQAVATAVKAAMDTSINVVGLDAEAKRKAFYIEPENHYKHHEFIDSMIDFMKDGKKTIFRTAVRLIVVGFFVLLIGGLVAWWKIKTGGA